MIRDEIIKWLKDNNLEAKLEHPAIEKFGDFAIRTGKPIENLSNTDLIEKTEFVAGFVNIWLSKNILVDEAIKIESKQWQEDLAKTGKDKTMVIDYSAPNIAKPFGIGHLRSTNIGQAIYNIYQTLGWKCIGDNHLGDWGTQFGKLIVAIKKWGDKEIDEMTINDLEKLYVKFHNESENNTELLDEARDWFLKLEKGDEEARDIWQKCIEVSMREFDKVYKMLGVKIDYTLGESFYQDKMPEIIKIMAEKGLIKESQGAKIVEFSNMPPAMVTKSNGATTYFTRDMATVKYRMDTWNPDLIIYEIGADQELHCRQIFETARLIGYKSQFYHVAHGLIRWKDGKFSTRKGSTIHLMDVIDKALEEAKKIAPTNSEDKLKAVAIGAIKFNDLATDPKKDIIFDWDKVMSMDGNSGPYLQYTYARCKSVLDKSSIFKLQSSINEVDLEKINDEETALLRYFYQYEEKIGEAAERFSPSVLAEYLINLARKYNEFYGKWRIVGEKEETLRAWLTERTAVIIKSGLTILGIEVLENM
jgi:arginyl-tRNA synthetase